MPDSLGDYPEVAWPISVAAESADALKKIRSAVDLDREAEMRHSAITIVFSAAAVEAALNAFVSRPTLRVENIHVRGFFGALLHRFFRASVPSKLRFLKEIAPTTVNDKVLLKRVGELCELRNRILHMYPEYMVARGPKPDVTWPERDTDWMECPDLVWTTWKYLTASRAIDGFEAATSFIHTIPPHLTEGPEDA